ncbi:hypothetical protein HZC30_01105 [Candidatus Woesearchaeota archaeon]|nr:hypothetical protein [Candidatus Woesearchaeota archaeon]
MAVNTSVAEPQGGMDPAKLYVWVKALESKVNNMLREMDLLKNNLVKKNDEMKKELKAMNDELMEMKSEQQKMSQNMDLIIKELKQTAGIEEVAVLKKYMDLWNPLNFVTQRDLERAVEAKIGSMSKSAAK